jgi:hypothetical protein
MQTRVRKFAHFLERTGLAMAGAACGLFVAAHVGSSVSWLTNQAFLLFMMLVGAIGFYLGIDTPPMPLEEQAAQRSAHTQIDKAEFLSAVGTFLATLTAFISVGVIVARETPELVWTFIILLGWIAGVVMQIIAGGIASLRAA